MRIITLRLPASLLERIDRVRVETGKSRSELIREALEWYLDSMRSQQDTGMRYKRVVLRC